jgi:hypothetical protein
MFDFMFWGWMPLLPGHRAVIVEAVAIDLFLYHRKKL